MDQITFQYPITFGAQPPISQHFGENKRDYASLGLKGHDGLDFNVLTFTPIFAARDGLVSATNDDCTGPSADTTVLWNFVKIIHPVALNSGYQTVYGHLAFQKVLVKVGDRVKAGQLIALSDNTGWSGGPHLHFALRQIDGAGNVLNRDNGYDGAIDPLPFLSGMPKPIREGDIIMPLWKARGWISIEKDLDAGVTYEQFMVVTERMWTDVTALIYSIKPK